MKNIIWKYDWQYQEWCLLRKTPELHITRIHRVKGGYELPSAWFGRNKDYSLKRKKTLVGAKKAVEKWLSDFVTSLK